MKSFRVALTLILGISSIINDSQLAQAALNTPKVGNCYNFTWTDVEGDGSNKGPVKCTSTHTAETYRVAKWDNGKGAFELTSQERWEVANRLCQPWKGNSKYLNYWAWYIPTQSQWDAGQRWVRCDAMITVSGTDPREFISWKGKRLDVK